MHRLRPVISGAPITSGAYDLYGGGWETRTVSLKVVHFWQRWPFWRRYHPASQLAQSTPRCPSAQNEPFLPSPPTQVLLIGHV
jgi:hypothetical protein